MTRSYEVPAKASYSKASSGIRGEGGTGASERIPGCSASPANWQGNGFRATGLVLSVTVSPRVNHDNFLWGVPALPTEALTSR